MPFSSGPGNNWHIDKPNDLNEPRPNDDGLFEYCVLPLRDLVIYPSMLTPLLIGREKSLHALAEANRLKQPLVVVTQRDTDEEEPSSDALYRVGTEIIFHQLMRQPDGSVSALARGQRRVQIVRITQDEPFFKALVRFMPDLEPDATRIEALQRTALGLFERVVDLNRNLPEEAYVFAINANSPGALADLIASLLDLNAETRQLLLQEADPMKRLEQIASILGHELNVLSLEEEIHSQVHREMERSQRENYLREQMRAIQTELGEGDFWAAEIAELRKKVKEARLPDAIDERAEQELARLQQMPPMAPETGIIRSYVDWLISLPWREATDDQLDLRHAEKVLNSRHYGLEKAKERIIEYLAVRQLAGEKMRQPILCFVGPPGTGKTSLGKSIAEALGRKFVRLSLGGVHDEAEIRGHRRTYIGALPGRILQTMKRAETINPVFMLDEIDKLTYDHRGDPASALLEVLDPEQNNAFSDHYLEIPYDLSKVLFITTANTLYTVPAALEDRMEVIEFNGYTDLEKIAIARRFVVPRQLEENGLKPGTLVFPDETLLNIIREYTYEAGVRNLDKQVAKVCRKMARRRAERRRITKKIVPDMLPELLGPPDFSELDAEKEDSVGVATALAWTPNGGDIMLIEVMTIPDGSGRVTLTGQMGNVMQESFQAGLTYLKSRAAILNLSKDDFEKTDIHVHLPEAAIRKEGPSAGITLTTALVSALAKIKVRRDVAMTGEITLRGNVLPIGGVKEKVLAAHRLKMAMVLLPKKNEKDLVDVPDEVRKAIDIRLVSHMDEVLMLSLLPPPPLGKPPRRFRKPPKRQPRGDSDGNGLVRRNRNV